MMKLRIQRRSIACSVSNRTKITLSCWGGIAPRRINRTGGAGPSTAGQQAEWTRPRSRPSDGRDRMPPAPRRAIELLLSPGRLINRHRTGRPFFRSTRAGVARRPRNPPPAYSTPRADPNPARRPPPSPGCPSCWPPFWFFDLTRRIVSRSMPSSMTIRRQDQRNERRCNIA